MMEGSGGVVGCGGKAGEVGKETVAGWQETWDSNSRLFKRGEERGNPQQALKDKGVIDSGCSRHMTGNISFLLEFEEINGGYVAFKGNPKGGKVGKEIVSAQQYVLLPLWSNGSQDLQNTNDDVADAAFDVKENENGVHVSANGSDKTDNKKHDEKAKKMIKKRVLVNAVSAPVNVAGPNLTNSFNIVSPSVNVVSPNFGIARKSSFVDPSKYPDDPDMPILEDIVYSDDEEDVSAEVDLSNLETNIPVSPILTTIIHKDHHVNQIIGDLNSAPQTRSMTRMVKEQGELHQINDEDFHTWIVIKNKARLVAQRHTQEEVIDYDEVFAPVARIEVIRLFLAYASFMGFMVYQMDVKSAFLYGTIEEEVYVCQPPGFKDPDYPDKVYKLVKALYGLHQAPRAWYETLANYLLENGFQRGKIDQTLFIAKRRHFASSGLQVKQKDDGIFISQDKYVAEILRKFGFTNVKSASTPIEIEKPLLKDHDVNAARHFIAVVSYELMLFGLMKVAAVNLMLLEAIIRRDLHLDDANGVECLPNAEIFKELARMGYEKPPPKLTFYKAVRKGFSCVVTPLFDSMLVQPQPQAEEGVEIHIAPAPPSTTSAPSPTDLQDPTPTPHTTPPQDQPPTCHDSPPQDQPTTPHESFMPLLVTLMETCATLSQKVDEIASIDVDEGIILVDEELDEEEVAMDAESQGRLNQEDVNAASKGVSAVSAPELVSAAKPTVFDDEDKLHDEEVQKATGRDKQERADMERALELQRQFDDKEENIDWSVVAEQESFKKLRAAEVSGSKSTQEIPSIYPKEMTKEDVQNMLKIIPVPEFKVEALQVKYPIIDWEIHTKGFDREDLVALWNLVEPSEDKEKALWVELKRLFELDADDVLWKLQRYMHAPSTWKLYSDRGVHHVSLIRGHDIFMSTKKDYLLSNVVMILMLSGKLQVEEDNEMARDLVMKIFMEAIKPRSRSLDTSSCVVKKTKKMLKGVTTASQVLLLLVQHSAAGQNKMESLNPQVVAAAKLPILNPNEFDLWKMRIEQYFLMTDYSLWEVILNGDSPPPTRIVDGVVQIIAPTTAEQRLAKKNKLKARGNLLMEFPDKHQLKFNIHKDAKSLI
nr:putative ribonuclease H-like domain-containing protein [Tanacetum cinerariifolium]